MEGFERVATGDHCEVWLSPRAVKVMRKAAAQHRGRCARIMQRFAESGPDDLTDEMFKLEERFGVGPGSVRIAVFAFKAFNLRVYGAYSRAERKLFVCTHAAVKKRDGADRDLLELVAREVWEICYA